MTDTPKFRYSIKQLKEMLQPNNIDWLSELEKQLARDALLARTHLGQYQALIGRGQRPEFHIRTPELKDVQALYDTVEAATAGA